MPLPIKPLDKDIIEINGVQVEYRSLSRDEVGRLAGFSGDPAGAETFMLSRSTGVTEAEAAEWRTQVDVKTADELLNAISVLSGLRPARGPSGN